MYTRITLLVTALLLILAGCNSARTPPGQVTVRGQVRDARTGAAVACDDLYLHFFCDDVGFQKSIEKESGTSYQVEMPGPVVRVRVFDPTGRYELFEQTVTVQGQGLDFDIPLQPTDYVLLKLRVINGHTGKPMVRKPRKPSAGPPVPGEGGPLFSFFSDGGQVARGYLSVDEAGEIHVRVPRAPIRVMTVNSSLGVANGEFDLTGCEGDETTYDLRME